MSVVAGEAIAKPSNPNKTIEQVDGVIKVRKEESNEGEKKPNDGEDDIIFDTIYELTISSVTFDDAFCNSEFIEQIEKIFQAWRPTYMADPCGKFARF